MATQPLDTLSAERWARLREDLRRCELRRGAWYPVLSVAQDEAVLVVRRRGVIIPLAYLEITHARPNRWTFLSRDGYAVCPNCQARSPLPKGPVSMKCGACNGVFEVAWGDSYYS